jgi:hypothetical protein
VITPFYNTQKRCHESYPNAPRTDYRDTNLCEQISPGVDPVFIPITPSADCEPLDCFECVKHKVEMEGGRIQLGWAIWEWPNVFIEAEHHAVYEPPAGSPWLDITPPVEPQIRRRLFLADNRAVYDFENEGVLKDNIRVALR